MDADTEVFSVDAIKTILKACDIKDLAIAPEINESYVFKNNKFGIKKIFKSFYKISGWSFKNYKKYFSDDLGENLFFKPLLPPLAGIIPSTLHLLIIRFNYFLYFYTELYYQYLKPAHK